MFSKRLEKIISKDSYTKEWRMKTAVCLFALGMTEMGIEDAITGNLDKKRDCYTLCKSQNIPFEPVWQLLK